MAELNPKLLRQLRKPITTPECVTGTKRIHISSLNMELVKKLQIPIQSPDMAEAGSSKEANRIRTLDESITGTADSGIKQRVRIDTRLDDDGEKDTIKGSTPSGIQGMTVGTSDSHSPDKRSPVKLDTPEADRATKAEGGEEQQPDKRKCNVYNFMRIVIDHFGMGYDYAFTGWNGEPLKAWWTIDDAVDMATLHGYDLTADMAEKYITMLTRQRYIESKSGGVYRRCAFWDMVMERWLRKVS